MVRGRRLWHTDEVSPRARTSCLLLAIALAAAAVADCGGSNAGPPSSCPAGSERCSCYGNGTCDVGLSCLSNRCVVVTGGGGNGVGGLGAGGAAGSAAGS